MIKARLTVSKSLNEFHKSTFIVILHLLMESANYLFTRNCQNATADAAATLRESTLFDIGMRTT